MDAIGFMSIAFVILITVYSIIGNYHQITDVHDISINCFVVMIPWQIFDLTNTRNG